MRELDEPANRILLHLRADFHIGNDTTGDQTRNLTEEHLLAVGGSHDGRRPLVLGRGLGMPRHQETPRMILEILHSTSDRHPVHVNVGNRHEDRNLQHLPIEVFALVHHFGHYDPAVARSEDQLRIMDLHTPRLPEKCHDKEPKQHKQNGSEPEQSRFGMARHQIVHQRPKQETDDSCQPDNLVAFLVYFHIRIVSFLMKYAAIPDKRPRTATRK